jgi:prolyl-tRNA editing enzyme YbaK/EbsC (Cys-tRNA(Pro) deacylase)
MSQDLPRAAEAVVAAGRARGLELDVREFPEGTRTAADAARAIGCQVDQIVKSGGNRVDVVKVGKERSAAVVRKADAGEVRAATGYAIGGTPPFGHARELTVLVDRHLTGFEVVWAAAGTPRHVFPIAPADLLKATGGQVADITLVEDGPRTG